MPRIEIGDRARVVAQYGLLGTPFNHGFAIGTIVIIDDVCPNSRYLAHQFYKPEISCYVHRSEIEVMPKQHKRNGRSVITKELPKGKKALKKWLREAREAK